MIRWPWQRQPIEPRPRRMLRIVLAVDGHPHYDISSALALSIIDCHFGKPIVHDMVICTLSGESHLVQLQLSEVDP